MAKQEKPHSAEYFGEQRDFWWNSDFVALMAGRWRLSEARTILDAGCGLGHWGRVLAPFLSPEAVVTGVDREPEWVRKAAEIAKARGLTRFGYREGDANALPFADDAFDLVTTCVEAGLGLDAALARVAEKVKGPFAEELARTLREVGMGRMRRNRLNRPLRRGNLNMP